MLPLPLAEKHNQPHLKINTQTTLNSTWMAAILKKAQG